MTDRTAFRLLPWLLAAAGIASAATPGMKPYSADYDASYMGMHGTGHMSLSQQGNGRWVYSLRIGSSLAQLSQSTVFDVAGSALRPLSRTFCLRSSSCCCGICSHAKRRSRAVGISLSPIERPGESSSAPEKP